MEATPLGLSNIIIITSIEKTKKLRLEKWNQR